MGQDKSFCTADLSRARKTLFISSVAFVDTKETHKKVKKGK